MPITPRNYIVRKLGPDGAPVLTRGLASFASQAEAEADAKARLAADPNSTFTIFVPVKSLFKQETPRVPTFPVGSASHRDCR